MIIFLSNVYVSVYVALYILEGKVSFKLRIDFFFFLETLH